MVVWDPGSIGGVGDDSYTGSDATDIMYGYGGADTLRGGGGDDALVGGWGNDAIDGGEGDDTLIPSDARVDGYYPEQHAFALSYSTFGNSGVSFLDGGAGRDTAYLTYGYATQSLHFDGRSADLVNVLTIGGSTISTVTHVEQFNIYAGSGDDVIFGGVTSSYIEGHDGNDRIGAGSGPGYLYGGTGDDVLSGGPGNDGLNGEAGVDTVTYEDLAISGVAADLGAGVATGPESGTDTLTGVENLIGSAFSDVLTGDSAANALTGGGGQDWLMGGGGGDLLIDDAGDDSVWGGAGDDALSGGEGNDTIDGGEGVDTATYHLATSHVEIDLTILEDQITRGAGIDTLISIENLVGSAFDDILVGSNGANAIDGGAGSDILRGQGGADLLTGGAGADTFVLGLASDSSPSAADLVTDFASGDRIDLSCLDANTALAGDQAFTLSGLQGHPGDIFVAYDPTADITTVKLYTTSSDDVAAQFLMTGDHHAITAADFIL
jgi:Ca2+-binding RTX toxin-like protein